MFFMQYVSFWVILPLHLSSISEHFGTLYRFHLQGQLPLKMEPIEGSEMLAVRTRTLGNYPKENTLHMNVYQA